MIYVVKGGASCTGQKSYFEIYNLTYIVVAFDVIANVTL